MKNGLGSIFALGLFVLYEGLHQAHMLLRERVFLALLLRLIRLLLASYVWILHLGTVL